VVGRDTVTKELSSKIYETTAKTYNIGRKADPFIVERIGENLLQDLNGVYLDVGCGTGNYTSALAQLGFDIQGLDLSPSMLAEAKKSFPELIWHESDMRNLPFPSQSFNGVVSINTLHYVRYTINEVFHEIKRILKQRGKFVLFLVTLEQCLQFWVGRYFPFFWELGKQILISRQTILDALDQVGFKKLKIIPYYITETSEDLYIYACKYRPYLLLDPTIREGMSPLQRPEYQALVSAGCSLLAKDIKTGKINDVINEHESDLGEGLFISASLE